jgi:hypothetical protein
MPEKNEIYSDIVDDLEDRSDWESRLIVWAQMRGTGVRRSLKPWPGAADTHVPVGDTIITKVKSYYVQWIFGPELLASFYSLQPVGDGYTSSVARWFDYQVRQSSNFSDSAICAIDSCLQNGMGFLKIWWDSNACKLCFTEINPYFIVVPPWTTDLDTADRVTHVMQISKGEYERNAENKGYNTDPDYLELITGEGKPDQNYAENQYRAEGLSYTRLKDLIVLWEVYIRQTDGNILVKTFSPLQPDEPARPDFKLPYRHKQVPIRIIPYELMNSAFYSPRGVMELVQMYEASACKTWNEKLDFMSIANRPVLSTQGGSINAQNIRWQPGAVYDSTLQLVQQPPPPVSFDEEIQSVKQMAEQRVGVPDFGIGQDQQPNKNRTATEVQSITQVMQQSNDLRARVLKGAMQKVYNQTWELLLQYKKDDLDYFWRKERSSLDPAAFSSAYVIRPNGSSDGYSRETEIQKLQQLRQLSQGAPWIKTNEIDKRLIELFDAEWVGEVYVEPEQVQQDQTQKQAYENTVMYDGFPPPVWPEDDHVVHLQTIDDYLKFMAQHQRQIPPDLMGIYLAHAQSHIDTAKKDHSYMIAHTQEINQWAQKVALGQKELQKMMGAQQQSGFVMQNMRGGPPPGPQGAPPPPGPMPQQMPGMSQVPPPPAPNAPPMPGAPNGAHP